MDFNITIVRVDNGYVCEWYTETEDDGYYHHQHVIVDKEGDEEESMLCLLWFIRDHFDPNCALIIRRYKAE